MSELWHTLCDTRNIDPKIWLLNLLSLILDDICRCQYLYFRLKDKVFVDSKPYDTKPFEDLLVAEFGNTKLSDIKHPK